MVFMQRDYPIDKISIPSRYAMLLLRVESQVNQQTNNVIVFFRILYFSTCATAFLVFAFYTGVLTSWMTAQEPPPPIRVDLVLPEKIPGTSFSNILYYFSHCKMSCRVTYVFTTGETH
jgi:predicted Na+-dependent transporter